MLGLYAPSVLFIIVIIVLASLPAHYPILYSYSSISIPVPQHVVSNQNGTERLF